MPQRLLRIDDLVRGQHTYLEEEDVCYYLREYTAHTGYSHSETNNLISNFKKKMDKRGSAQWRYKGQAIDRVAADFRACLPRELLEEWTLVPIPPSKAKTDPLYDDRMSQVLAKMSMGYDVDIRELVTLDESMEASHTTTNRLPPNELKEHLSIDEEHSDPEPNVIILFDDVLTTGSHFKACKALLEERFPNAEIAGMFVARRAIPDAADDFDDIDDI